MKELFKQSYVQKTIAMGILILSLWLLKDILNLILLTFLFTYLFYTVFSFVEKRTNTHPKILLLLVYGTFVSILSIVLYKYAPIITKEMMDISTQLSSFQFDDYKGSLNPNVYEYLRGFDFSGYLRDSGSQVIKSIANVGSFAIQVIMAFLLSFFFLLEKDKCISFLSRFEKSKVSFLYQFYKEFGQNFLNTFGKVVQIQIMIAGANSVLSFFGLWIIGFHQLLGLSIMIFILGLIPVAGTFISMIPLTIIAFKIGGLVKILHVLILIVVIHAAENYVLNPKLYSLKMKLPIFFTFLILIVSEHLMGVWGLLLGIPLFMFVLDIIKYPNKNAGKTK